MSIQNMSYLEAMVKGQWIELLRLEIRLLLLLRLKERILTRGLVRMQSNYQRNKKKRTYNEALREDVMYGIVSTGVD